MDQGNLTTFGILTTYSLQGGDKIPRKGGPGISQSDLLVVNKVSNNHRELNSRHLTSHQIDLAPHVGASLDVMAQDSKLMRGDGPTLFTSVRQGTGVDDVGSLILAAWRAAGSPGKPGAVGEAA